MHLDPQPHRPDSPGQIAQPSLRPAVDLADRDPAAPRTIHATPHGRLLRLTRRIGTINAQLPASTGVECLRAAQDWTAKSGVRAQGQGRAGAEGERGHGKPPLTPVHRAPAAVAQDSEQAERCGGRPPVGSGESEAVRSWPRGEASGSGPGRAGLGPGGLSGEGATEVGKDGLHGEGIVHGGDDAQPAATAGTGEDVEGEHAAHQGRPGPRARGDGDAGASVGLLRLQVGFAHS